MIKNESNYLKVVIFSSFIFLTILYFRFLQIVYEKKYFEVSLKWRVLGISSLLFFLFILGLIIFRKKKFNYFINIFLKKINQKLGISKSGAIFISLFSFISVIIIFVYFSKTIIQPFWVRIAILGLLILFNQIVWRNRFNELTPIEISLLTVLLFSTILKVFEYIPYISNSPFSLRWGEGSLYYYSSLYFSKSIYGKFLPLPTLNPAHHFLQSLPFLIPQSTIFFHRLWHVFLGISCTAFTSWLLIKRFVFALKPIKVILIFWSFLFILSGPVYFELLICVIIVVLTYTPNNTARNLFFIVLASLWAGLCRINWFPMPALIGIILYVLYDKNNFKGITIWEFIKKPFLYLVSGFAGAIFSQTLYISLSGVKNIIDFFSSFNSPLLWYRLFPNSTYPIGLLNDTIINFLPITLFIVFAIKKIKLDFKQYLTLILISLVLLLGGLVVSVKIGGGANLHDLDAFMISLLITFLFIINHYPSFLRTPKLNFINVIIIIVLLLPAKNILTKDFSIQPLKSENELTMLSNFKEIVFEDNDLGNQTLFVGERQLIPFYMPSIDFETNYEIIDITEKAMSNRQDYFAKLSGLLSKHKYGLIITSRVSTNIFDRSHGFSEENNVVVNNFSNILLEYYELDQSFPNTYFQIFRPKQVDP